VFVLDLQVSMGTIHATFGSFGDAKEKVLANRGGVSFTFLFGFVNIDGHCTRGATMIHCATRRLPHALNLLRQIDIVERCGGPGVEQQQEDSGQCKRNITIYEMLFINLSTATED